MTEVTIIKPKDDFSFIRRARRGLPERDQLLKNFTGVSSLNDGNVLYYKLFRSPSDDPPEGRGPEDTVEDLGADKYQPRVNAITKDVVNMSRQSLITQPTVMEPAATTITGGVSEKTRKEWTQYLNVMYIAFRSYASRAVD